MAPCLSANKHDASVCVKCYDIGEARLRTPSEYVELSPTITARCGTGGNNVPAVVYDARGNGDGNIAPTITGDHNNRVTDYTTVVCCIDGDKIGKAERAGGSGLGIRAGDRMYTLTSKDAGSHAVCYANTYQKVTGPLMANSHPGSYCGQDAYSDMLVVGTKPLCGVTSGAQFTGKFTEQTPFRQLDSVALLIPSAFRKPAGVGFTS